MRIPLAASSAAILMIACASSKSAAPATPAVVEVNPSGVPGKATATRYQKLTAKVTAVDAAARTLTIQGDDGSTETLKVPPEVKRFGEIAVGDTIAVELEQGLLLEYQPAGSETIPPQAVVAGARAGAEAPPGGAVAGGVMSTVTITAIDAKARLVTFQGPGGNSYQVKAGPQIQLEKLKVGDRLLATYIEAVAIQIEKAGAKL